MDSSDSTSDCNHLLETARKGNPDAIGRLLETYRPYLTLLARIQVGRRLQGKVDATDLVQDVFLEAHRQFGNFRGDTSETFSAWLRKILAGQLIALVRRYCHSQSRDVTLERSLELELDSSSDHLWRGLKSRESTPSGAASRREDVLRLADALERLAPDYREVIVLRQIEGMPFAEIARHLARTEDSVQKLWVRGLAALRRMLEAES